ncbi:MAG TPA: DUF111 family protein [Candidatus Hydrogenedentes bacterium]|nr:DUF111 family protein [Candidatus Hydrogenedentota bacterium]
MGRRAFFNCFSGISGDMTVGALIDAGAPFSAIEEALRSLDVPGFRVQAERVTRRGLGGTAFRVEIDPDAPRPHRHLRHMEEIARPDDAADALAAAICHGCTIGPAAEEYRIR